MENFKPWEELKMTLPQWAKLKAVAVMTLLYHVRFFMANLDEVLGKLKKQRRANMEALGKARHVRESGWENRFGGVYTCLKIYKHCKRAC